MKKGFICKCSKCGFMTNEKNKTCPLCDSPMDEIEHEEININPTLPEKLDNNENRDVKMGYYCFKDRRKMKTKVCLDCNNVGSLYLEYNNKTAIIKRINSLSEVFTPEEIEVILKNLTEEEKVYIYHNYESSYRFFYKKDKPKSIVCFVFSIVFYLLFLDITFNMNDKGFLFASYIFNSIGNTFLVSLIILGIWFLFDATSVEFKKIPIKVVCCVLVPNLIYLALALVMNFNIKWCLIAGYIAMVISGLVYLLYYLWEKKHEK